MSDYVTYLCKEFFNKLSQTEQKDLIIYLTSNLRNDNKQLLQSQSDSEVFFNIVHVLVKNRHLSPSNSDLLIKAFEFINKNDFALQLTNYDKNIKNQIKSPGQDTNFVIKVNDQDIELKFKPHNFQLSLAKHSFNRINNIIVVRTGSGKTLISAIICKYWFTIYSKQNRLNNFKVAFIVPTRYLANQQCKLFEKAFDTTVLQEVNEKACEKKIHEYFKSKSIIFLTAQKLINTLNQGYFKLSDFSILIFDEVHHCDDYHPYNQIMMSFYFKEKIQNSTFELPLVIGLTASLGSGNGNTNSVRHLLSLCSNLDCKEISAVSDQSDLNDLETNIPSVLNDTIVQVEQGAEFISVEDEIKSCILKIASICDLSVDIKRIGEPDFDTTISILRDKVLANNLSNLFSNCNTGNGIIAIKYLWELNLLYNRIYDFSFDYSIEIFFKFFDESNVHSPIQAEILCRESINDLISYMKLNKNRLFNHYKLDKLADLIAENHDEYSKGIVLVRTRHHTQALYNFVISNQKLKTKIKPVILTGQGTSEDLAMTDEVQKKNIEKFRTGESNLLIATDIAQEGLDIPECSYVIRYEFVSNEIGTVQSRGRARAHKGKCFLITSKNSLNYRREKENKIKEQQMEQALKELKQLDKNLHDKLYNQIYEMKFKKIQILNTNIHASNISTDYCFKAEQVQIICRNCNKQLFTGADLVYREPSYYCNNLSFIKNLINFKEKKFYCSDKSCNKELGQLVEFRKQDSMHMIDIRGIKFMFPRSSTAQVKSQWSKVNEFEIKQIKTGH